MQKSFASSIATSSRLRKKAVEKTCIVSCARSDNINVHELGDMLRYLGFSVGGSAYLSMLARVRPAARWAEVRIAGQGGGRGGEGPAVGACHPNPARHRTCGDNPCSTVQENRLHMAARPHSGLFVPDARLLF